MSSLLSSFKTCHEAVSVTTNPKHTVHVIFFMYRNSSYSIYSMVNQSHNARQHDTGFQSQYRIHILT